MGFNKDYGKKKAGMIALAVLFGLIVTLVVMLLWNWLMPDIFGLTTINFWQALGLLVLSKIFFSGGWKKSRHGSHNSWQWKRRFMKKWENMSEEERENIKEHFKPYC